MNLTANYNRSTLIVKRITMNKEEMNITANCSTLIVKRITVW